MSIADIKIKELKVDEAKRRIGDLSPDDFTREHHSRNVPPLNMIECKESDFNTNPSLEGRQTVVCVVCEAIHQVPNNNQLTSLTSIDFKVLAELTDELLVI